MFNFCDIHNYNNQCIVDTFPASARKFSSREIEESTTSFNDLIGKGAFGKVYRGIYHGTAIAVKVLNEDTF